MKASAQTAHDEMLVDRVRAALADIAGVKEKKMFGSIAFMVRGKMCVSARAQRIMCRIEPSLHDAAVKREGCRTVIMRGRQFRGYVYVDSEAIKTGRALKYWIKLALDYREAQAKLRSRTSRQSERPGAAVAQPKRSAKRDE
jgi:TfoX/Sxy family transcriptional regulator of competence genes